jgi:hypothetical protein
MLLPVPTRFLPLELLLQELELLPVWRLPSSVRQASSVQLFSPLV